MLPKILKCYLKFSTPFLFRSVLQIMDNFVSNVEIKPGESLQLESENVRIQAMDWHPDVENGTWNHDLRFTVPSQYDFEVEEDVEITSEDEVQNKINNTVEMTDTTTTIRPQEMPPKVPVSTAIS